MLNYQIYHNTCKTLNNFGLDDFYIHFVRVIHCLTVYVLCSVNQTVFLNSSFQSHVACEKTLDISANQKALLVLPTLKRTVVVTCLTLIEYKVMKSIRINDYKLSGNIHERNIIYNKL